MWSRFIVLYPWDSHNRCVLRLWLAKIIGEFDSVILITSHHGSSHPSRCISNWNNRILRSRKRSFPTKRIRGRESNAFPNWLIPVWYVIILIPHLFISERSIGYYVSKWSMDPYIVSGPWIPIFWPVHGFLYLGLRRAVRHVHGGVYENR